MRETYHVMIEMKMMARTMTVSINLPGLITFGGVSLASIKALGIYILSNSGRNIPTPFPVVVLGKEAPFEVSGAAFNGLISLVVPPLTACRVRRPRPLPGLLCCFIAI
jgi:hypothetical protein